MAVLAIGAIGAAALGPLGLGLTTAAMGWNIGTLVGGYLFGPKGQDITQQGPRLGDLKVQASTYGNPIPIGYGSIRLAGNVIWSRDIVETTHTTTQSSGGKGGGGGGSVTQTSYTYSQSFAVSLCEGEIAGIRKIWANGKLIYNLADDADIATIIASNKKAAGIRIYTGSETQTADSLIQATVGAANTPAYRGTVYVVFENLQLADYGNRMPNLEFEVVDNGTGSITWQPVGYTMPAEVDVSNFYTSRMECPTNGLMWFKTTTGQTNFVQVNVLNGAIIRRASYPAATGYNCSNIRNMQDGSALIRWANYGGVLISAEGVFTAGTYYTGEYSAFRDALGTIWSYAGTSIYTEFRTPQIAPAIALTFSLMSGNAPGYIYGHNAATNTIHRISTTSGATAAFWTCPNTLRGVVPCYNGNVWALHDAGSIAYATLLNSNGTALTTITITGGTAIYNGSTTPFIDKRNGSLVGVISGGFSGVKVFRIEPSYALIVSDPLTYSMAPSWNSNGIAFTAGWISGGRFLSIGDVVSVSARALSSIVSNICTRAGLTAGQIDVTALTDEVSGYLVQRSTARAQLEQLMRAFYFDAVESDGKVKFVKRGGSSAVSIPEDDLAAHEYGSSPPDTLITNRQQEMELPVDFNVQYMDTGAAYQIGSQYSQRLTTNSENKASLNLAIAMTATKAKQIADVLMYDAWTGRTTFDQSHGWKYSYLEPTDIITVTKGGRSYVMRIVDEDASGGIYRRRAVLEDTTVYTQTATAAGLTAPDQTVAGVPLTNMLLLDIPLLRDQDDGVGFYAAACGYGSGWTGAQAFKSNDNGATWGSFGNAFLNAATIGSASTALGDFTQNIFDETNSVTVVLLNGELASDTELNVLNGANVALLGNEIIQFKNATLIAANTYTLTGLLRGRQGTEWARSTHAIGDRFVLLSSSTTYLFTGTSTEYDSARKYRGVSFGGFLDDASNIDFTHTAVAKECYAPVQLGGGRNAALDVILIWTRRTRIGGGWNNYSDVPLGEAAESYEVEIWDSGYTTLKRTITGLSSPTTTYTAAQQTTDFGGTQATVYWKVFQLSADRGRGYEAKGTT